ncbi:MAG TPA: hypothetical protein VGD58_34065, partial [Herpetosiphonaceae bacterium]
MKISPFRIWCQLALLLLMVLTSVAPAPSRAQDQTPPPSAESLPSAQEQAAPRRFDAKAVIGSPADAPAQEMPEAEATAIVTDEAAPADAAETAETYAPLDEATNDMQPSGVQGVVGLDVSAPDTIRASNFITYTYAYTNTGSSSVTGVEIDLIWANATINKTTNSTVLQHCPAAPDPDIANCGLLPNSIVGPNIEVIRAPALTGTSVTMRVRLGTLSNGQSGRFSVHLRSNATKYPRTGETISRPSSSAKLYLTSTQTTPTSDDTANTMIIGPVFALTKAPTRTDKVYPVVDTVEFVITLGNATGPGDVNNGQRRADAIAATNVSLTDTFPLGTELVSATPSGTATSTNITWTIPNLAVGQVLEFRLVFRKIDNNVGCDRVNNRTYTVTSNEMPLNGASRYTVPGDAATVDVVTPLVIKSVVATPSSVVYGNEATITIVVQNFWNQNLNGVQLNYDIQPNGYYVAGSANPTATAAPNGSTPGGRVSWTFSINAGSKTTATEKTFSLRVRAGYNSDGDGSAQIIAPAGVPAACIKAKNGKVSLKPRLTVKKYTDADPDTNIGGNYIVTKGQQFPYIVDITNAGVTDALNVTLTDVMPNELGANFAYVPGSGTLNGQPRAPDSFSNGPGGIMVWQGLNIPAGGTIRIRYALQVDGFYYVEYCNEVEASVGQEDVTYAPDHVCVKINPQIEVRKTANKTSAGAGEEVQFTLTLTNRESTTFHVGLYDYLDKFTYVRQISGYAQPSSIAASVVQWPLVDVGPGQQIQVVIVAKLPDPCDTTGYDNEVLFRADIGGGTIGIIQPIPRVRVRVSCIRLEYSKTVDRTTISLSDRHMYTLTIRNANPDGPVANVVVDDMLPQGFSFVSMDASSAYKVSPTQSQRADGRTKLSWTIPLIASNATTTIKFIALSGNIVGNHENWLVASLDGVAGTCKSGCITVDEGGTGVTYSMKAVSVSPLITIAPEIVQTNCAKPGDKRTYRLVVVNTNTHAYTGTNITATLPFGLNYVQQLGTTPPPRVITDNTGTTKLTWLNQTIPAKPANAFGSQVVFEVEIQVGQVWGEFITVEQASSPDGAIPRKDGVQNASVVVCPTQPSIGKDVNRRIVRIGDEVRYMISLANTNTTALNATVQDQLPQNLTYLGTVSGGNPTINGQTLSWNVNIPAASGGKAGATTIIFRVRVDSGDAGDVYTNTATVTSGGTFDTTRNTIAIVVAES